MNWEEKDWMIEDLNFAAKRKVNNKSSWRIPHIIGAFYSTKMNRTVEYESLAEYFFYLFLEIDKQTKRYYTQPIEVDIPYIDKERNKKSWIHVPDVLIFRQGAIPKLVQIKGANSNLESERLKIVNRFCVKYANLKGWDYKIIYPKALPKEILRNIRFLSSYTKKRSYYDTIIDEAIERLRFHESMTIYELAYSFIAKTDVYQVIPSIYFLIATGVIYADLASPINTESIIYLCARSNNMDMCDIGEKLINEGS